MGQAGGSLPSLPLQLRWSFEGIKDLGVFLRNETVEKKNWEGMVDALEQRLMK